MNATSLGLTSFASSTPLRAAIAQLTRTPEVELLPSLIDAARVPQDQAAQTQALALRIAEGVRRSSQGRGSAGLVQGLMQTFALSSNEGVALMCLAEALLRIPDDDTRDALIRDKLATKPGDDASKVDWSRHLGQSPSLFVNAAAWGLVVTGKLVSTHSEHGLGASLKRIVARGGEPLIRSAVEVAMRMLGEQFVTGQTIEEALANAQAREARGFRFSYDMLGEAAVNDEDAQRYLAAYEHAIHAIGRAAQGRGVIQGPGISIKLSALHPRYSRAQIERVMADLYPRLLHLAALAKQYGIGLNLDAEESERLELSLSLLERLCHEPSLAGWDGIGVVVQAYQKRCPAVLDWLIDLARRSQHRLMVRLVKGAYWDSEIKRAQLEGLDGYPVYTRKAYTDVAYLACARKLLAAPAAVFAQFATHNAHTCAAIQSMAGPHFDETHYEFQCLHGMGEPLYEQIIDSRPCRVYAPVGTHETLLAYLVRRLLENGANSSFVNRIADPTVSLEDLVQDPVATVQAMAAQEGVLGQPHPGVPLPSQLYAPSTGPGGRVNARGLDLNDESTLAALAQQLADLQTAPNHPFRQPVNDLSVDQALAAFHHVATGAQGWAHTAVAERARCLEATAQALEDDRMRWIALLVDEAGKTCANALSEVREAVDFLRFDAQQIRRDFDNATHRPLGVVVCISPWNFPLAIFLGQVAAALAAGNVVLAKPAEQTPRIAQAAVHALHRAGVPASALQLVPGPGPTVGAALVADARVQGVLFTGSTDVARRLQHTLAQRLDARGQPVTLIAETGGQNTMLVDSSALLEQAAGDIVTSAFDSAGQRCSALRVLFVQDDVADALLTMLRGAMQALVVGHPYQLATDVGPVIDNEAASALRAHIQAMRERGLAVWQPCAASTSAVDPLHHRLIPPTLIELDALSSLHGEVFGPVLHVLRFKRDDLPQVLARIGATGFGLTQGVHTRIDETVDQVVASSTAGNVYVNRNMVGAVVGVQPFGGEGLSGTGPKAGGPLYLLRLLAERPRPAARQAVMHGAPARGTRAPGAQTAHAEGPSPQAATAALLSLQRWAQTRSPSGLGGASLVQACDALREASPVHPDMLLRGPTGESNRYATQPRQAVVCLAADGVDGDADRLIQLAAVLAVGGHALWPVQALRHPSTQALHDNLPADVRACITLAPAWDQPKLAIDGVLQHGDTAALLATASRLAQRPGPIVALIGLARGDVNVPLERLVVERSVSINTAAAGGNASLMTLSMAG
jgi:RHH-type transcriptional regulator, proline utilization regulon repressor / proline dehydrogenase / delta 1-pyrroline-5-carboxylate dehydrogenase